jgi:Arc/MetJ-type ribon-helix-helix transcriptional regulator
MNDDAKRTYRTKTGRILTDEEIEALAAEAEGGYDVTEVARRPGRPRMGSAPATVVPVRLPADLHTAVKGLAEAESTSLSEVVRDALRRYLASEAPSSDFRTASGRVLTDAEISALAAEAEAGYDVSALRGRPRRRSSGRAEVVPVRMPPELKAQVERRAEAEWTSVSEVVREALRARLDGDDSDPRGAVRAVGLAVTGRPRLTPVATTSCQG